MGELPGRGTKTRDLLLGMSEVLLNSPVIEVCETNAMPQ